MDMESIRKNSPLYLLLIAVFGLALMYLHQEDRSGLVTALMFALASMSIGAVVGFLFGIPKTVQRETQDSKEDGRPDLKRKVRNALLTHRPNTNLEEVSDWLTKIIVGVSLVEFQNIGSALERAAGSVAATMGNNPDLHKPYIMAVLIFFLMLGFMMGYLLTRLFLANLFSQADIDIENLSHIEDRVENIEDQIRKHSEVESLVAQADSYRRSARATPADKIRLLDKAEATLEIALHIDSDNIPAHIVRSKCYSDRNDQEKAWKILEELEEKLRKRGISAKTQARINYNKACYYFLHAAIASNKTEQEEMTEKSYNLLRAAVDEEETLKVIARNDDDFKGARKDKRFIEIVGR